MSTQALWPGSARAAVSITVDNLGEAAEIELGFREPGAPLGGHYSVTTALPIVLGELAAARLSATFFVEGINAEIYPEALREIGEAGHELGFHAWCHEDWSALDPDAEVANVDRSLAALHKAGIDAVGFRPPGGRLTPRTIDLLAARGLRHCSPAGSTAGLVAGGLAVIPFAWPAVDAFHILPAFAPLREHIAGDPEPGGADAVRTALLQSVEDALATGGHSTLVLHTWMIEMERDAVRAVLARVRDGVDAGELWAAPCRNVAAWMVDRAASFTGVPQLDPTSWTSPA